MAADGKTAAPTAAPKAAPPAAAAVGWQMVGGIQVYRGDGRDRSQDWLLTFTDLSALMLTFFVLLFSMSTIETADWQNLVDALKPASQNLQQVTIALPQSEKAAETVERLPGTDLAYLAAVLKEQMNADAVLKQVRVSHEGAAGGGERLVISVPGDLLFGSGSIELGETGGKAAFTLGGVLRNLRNVIEIAGHADPTPVSAGYASNWELSLARAAVLSDMLSKAGYQGRIVVRGYGDSRYAEVDPTLDEAARRALARRVDIVVHAYASESR